MRLENLYRAVAKIQRNSIAQIKRPVDNILQIFDFVQLFGSSIVFVQFFFD
jgi:hypothetical protein